MIADKIALTKKGTFKMESDYNELRKTIEHISSLKLKDTVEDRLRLGKQLLKSANIEGSVNRDASMLPLIWYNLEEDNYHIQVPYKTIDGSHNIANFYTETDEIRFENYKKGRVDYACYS